MSRSSRTARHPLHRATYNYTCTYTCTCRGNLVEHLRCDEGQATTEYALILLAAAMVALLAIGWATSGGGAGKIGGLFDTVIDAVLGSL